MKPRGLSIDNINKRYRGTSGIHSPAGHVDNRVIIGSPVSQIHSPIGHVDNRVIIGSPTSQIHSPAGHVDNRVILGSAVNQIHNPIGQVDNRVFLGSAANQIHSPIGQVENRVIIGSPTSQIVQPSAFRAAVVPTTMQVAQPSQLIRQSYVRSNSPVIYQNAPLAYPSLSPAPAITTTTVRRSRLASVVPGPIVEQHTETIQEQAPTVIKKTVVV